MTNDDKDTMPETVLRIKDLPTALRCIEALINRHAFEMDDEELFRKDVRHSFMMIRGAVKTRTDKATVTIPREVLEGMREPEVKYIENGRVIMFNMKEHNALINKLLEEF